MKRLLLAILAVVFASVTATQAQSPLTSQVCHDTILQTYAKLIFANQVGLIESHFNWGKFRHQGEVLSQVLKDNELTFELSNFKEGNIGSSQARLTELETYLGGKPIIIADVTRYTFDTPERHDLAEYAVTIREGVGQVFEGADRFVISDLNRLAEPGAPKYSKYISYDVVATYKGNKSKYHASFVFNEAGNAAFLDPFVQGITNYTVLSVYPEVLLNWTINENHDVAEWARANSTTGTPSGQMSCDLKTLKCLIPAADIVEKSKPQQAGLGSAGTPART